MKVIVSVLLQPYVFASCRAYLAPYPSAWETLLERQNVAAVLFVRQVINESPDYHQDSSVRRREIERCLW